jgi:ABC-type transport system substrate-binding protein
MNRKLTRRQLLKYAALSGMGVAAAELAGYGTFEGQAQPAQPIKRGGILKVSTMYTYPTLDPHISTTADNAAFPMVYDALLNYKYNAGASKWEIKPGLATAWEIADPQTAILKLRRGVKFSDGSDFNA